MLEALIGLNNTQTDEIHYERIAATTDEDLYTARLDARIYSDISGNDIEFEEIFYSENSECICHMIDLLAEEGIQVYTTWNHEDIDLLLM